MATVALERVEKIYANGAVGLGGVSLAVAEAELMVLVGPSGCGKSTLLRLVAGLEQPSAGRILLDGRDVTAVSPQGRNVAMVFQDYALYPHLTVEGNLAFPLRMRRMAKAAIAERVRATAALLELGPLLGRLPRELSGGQRQRVAMGRALVREPSAFLLDEPLSNLDAKLRGQVRTEIEELQRRTRTTMLYVTHDQVEAMTLGHRLAVLDRGRLHQVGTPGEVYRRPANVFVAGFIGSPPMNLVPAALERGGERDVLVVDGQRMALPPLPETVRRAAGGGLTLGVRPEGLRLAAADDAGVLHGTTAQVEQLGHETLVHVRAGDHTVVVRTDGLRACGHDERVALALDPERLYWFDAAGEALAAPSRTDT